MLLVRRPLLAQVTRVRAAFEVIILLMMRLNSKLKGAKPTAWSDRTPQTRMLLAPAGPEGLYKFSLVQTRMRLGGSCPANLTRTAEQYEYVPR